MLSRGFSWDRLRWTYPDVPLPLGVERPTFEDIGTYFLAIKPVQGIMPGYTSILMLLRP